MIWKEKIANIPLGASKKKVGTTNYLVTKTEFNQGKSCKVFAQELGGNDFISFNFYRTVNGDHLKPCEMSVQKVMDFLATY